MKRFNSSNLSVKGKIILIFGCFVLFMLLFLWLFQTVFLESFYRYVKTRNVHTSTVAIAENIDHKNLDALIERLQYEENVNIQIWDQSGNLKTPLLSFPHPSVRLSPSVLQTIAEKTALYENPHTEIVTFHNTHAPEYDNHFFRGNVPPPPESRIHVTVCAMQVQNQTGENLMILSSAPITPIDSIAETLQIQLIIIACVLLILFLALAHVLSRQIAEPIVQVNLSAHQLAEGNYQESFQGKGYQEIAELSHTLNYAARELSKLEKLRQELIANVSHDLRTPLTMIKGYGEIMRDIPGENTPENIQLIIDETTRLNSLVSDMLDLSRLQAGALELHPSPFNLTQSIQELLQRYTRLMEQEHYQIVFEPQTNVMVVADELKISQVVYNLINNAIHYTGADKQVRIEQLLSGDRVRIAVHDTGAGVSDAEKPYIWQRYYRTDKPHKRAAIGTGLGLAIVRNVLELHGCAYGVESDGKSGATFWFEMKTAELEKPM